MALDRDTTFTWNGHSSFEIRSPGGKALVPVIGEQLVEHLYGADWQRPGGALAIMNPATYVRLREQALPMQVLHEDPRRVLVRKP